MRVVARRRDGYTHEVEIDTGHTIVIDEPVALGGNGRGTSPTRAAATGLAACTAITCEMYAARKGWELGAVEVRGRDRAGPWLGVRGDHRLAANPCAAQRRAARPPARDRGQVPGPPGTHGRGRDPRPDRERLSVDLGLSGRACAITGASRGIGLETARLLCRRGRLGAACRPRRGAARRRRRAMPRRERRRRGRSAGPGRDRARRRRAIARRRPRKRSAASTYSSTTPAPPAGATSTTSPRPIGTPRGS